MGVTAWPARPARTVKEKMMQKIERPAEGRPALPFYFPAALALLAASLMLPGAARAQQWTGCGANNTSVCTSSTTANVGVGTASPTNGKLEITSDDGAASGEHNLLYGSRSGSGSGGINFGYRADGTSVTGGFIRSLNNLSF